ncbi:MAG: EAL domain-containing protein [Pseudomonadota bacterium]
MTCLALLATGLTKIDQDLQLIIAVIGVICAAIVFGQALQIRDFLSRLPGAMKDAVRDPELMSFPQQSAPDELGHFTREMRDFAVSMREVLEQRTEMERMAHTDPLTSLPNRRGLTALLDRLAGDPAAGRSLGGIGLLHLDLDHFKAVNDRLGHDAGDHVLCEATRLISAAIRDSDYLARLGGDEFIVVAPGVETDQILIRIAERITEKFSIPIVYEHVRCQVGVSIGMVLGGLRGKLLDPQRLLLNADIALCHAKSNGRNRHAMFSTTMARSNRRQENQAEEIRQALDKDLFRPWYQPVFDFKTGRVCSVQVIPRWEDSAYGFIDPDDFVTPSDAFNLIEELGLRVFEHACRSLAVWKREYPDFPVLQVCMNRVQMLDTGIADRVSWCLDDLGLGPADVAFSASEPCFSGRNAEMVLANLNNLKRLGCSIVLDDFGAEGGSFANLAALQPAGIIASSRFTKNLAKSGQAPADTILLQALVGGANGLGIWAAAKNIDAPGQIERVKDFGISRGSGNVIYPVKSEADLIQWLADEGHLNTQFAAKTAVFSV